MSNQKVKQDSVVVYSEFKDSDWYIYWDREYSRVKKYQLLIVWNIHQDDEVYYDFMHLEKLISTKNSINGLPYRDKLSESDKILFQKICSEFVDDVNREFID